MKMKLNKLDALVIWNGLRQTPPKAFKNMGEIKSADAIIDILFEAGKPLTENIVELESSFDSDASESQLKKTIEDYNRKSAKLENKYGNEDADIKFKDSLENDFKKFVSRWSMQWFTTIEKLIAFEKRLGYNIDKGSNTN